MRHKKKLLVLLVLIVAPVVYVQCNPLVFNESLWQHAHCMPQAFGPLFDYAQANGGKFPFHANGYGDALLLLPDDTPWYAMTGPGYDGDEFAKAKRNGAGLPESKCGRVYVQGLTTKSNSAIAILFDKVSTPGGDHCHFPSRLWAEYGREVLLVGGMRSFVGDNDWKKFAAEQVELLVKEGWDRNEASRLYAQATP